MAPPAALPRAETCKPEELHFDRQAIIVKTHASSSGIFQHIGAQYRAAALPEDTWAMVDVSPGPIENTPQGSPCSLGLALAWSSLKLACTPPLQLGTRLLRVALVSHSRPPSTACVGYV